MNDSLISIARDNTIRVSTLKLNNIAKLIVNQKVNNAINQLKFSQKRISTSVLKVLNAARLTSLKSEDPLPGLKTIVSVPEPRA